MIRFPCRLALVILTLVLAGCAGERPPLTTSAPALAGPYRIDTGDELRIVVYEQPSLTNLYEVDQAGLVSLPLIGDVPARSLTTDELASRITGELAMSYLREPDVTVEVNRYRPFFVLGEVGNPGQYEYVPGMSAETAIAVAGGFTPRANMRLVRISRTLGDQLFEGKISVTEPIRPGDTIYVYERLL
jgi:polysaccharide export outer membrane protein